MGVVAGCSGLFPYGWLAMNPHDVRSTDGEVCCNCGRTFPTLAAHTSHFGIETARAAIAGRVESPTRASGPDEGRSSSQEIEAPDDHDSQPVVTD